MAHHIKGGLVDDSITSTPMPQASSTVDRRNRQVPMSDFEPVDLSEQSSNRALQQGIAAIEEMKKKLSIFTSDTSSANYWKQFEDSSLTASTDFSSKYKKPFGELIGDSILDLNDEAKKATLQMEESGFTNIQNLSDLDRDEILCSNTWGGIPSDQINLSITAIQNSAITPPDFMPTEDSLFLELQSYNSDDKFLTKASRKLEIPAQDISSVKHDVSYSNTEIPSISDIALALKECEEDANPRKLMDEVLKAEKKALFITVCDKSSKNKEKLTELVDVSNFIPDTKATEPREECLFWGSVKIGDSSRKILFFAPEKEGGEVYRFTVEGNPAFKILRNWPKEAIPSNQVVAHFKNDSTYEMNILFQPFEIGQAKALIKIQSESQQIMKLVNLYGYGGKGQLLLHAITVDPYLNTKHLILSRDQKTNFILENIGTSTLFFYINFEHNEEFFYLEPKLGFINANDAANISLAVYFKNLRKEAVSNWMCSSHDKYINISKLNIFYGDESTRLRLINLIVKSKEDSSFQHIIHQYPFLNSFLPSNVDVSSLNDSKECFSELAAECINKTEIIIKTARNALLEVINLPKQEHTDRLTLWRSKR